MKKPSTRDYRKGEPVLPSRTAVNQLVNDPTRSISNYAKLSPTDASGKQQVKLRKMYGGR